MNCGKVKEEAGCNYKLEEARMDISVENVQKGFNGINILSNVNIRVNSGDTMLIVGKNGAGKTTLLRLILGLYQPDRGNIK